MAQGSLILCGLMYLVFGVWFLVSPVQAAALVSIRLDDPTAVTEVRAFYGGLEIGLAAFLLLCAARPSLRVAGLIAGMAAYGVTAAGRIVGLAIDRPQAQIPYIILVVELAMAGLCTVALARERRSQTEGQVL